MQTPSILPCSTRPVFVGATLVGCLKRVWDCPQACQRVSSSREGRPLHTDPLTCTHHLRYSFAENCCTALIAMSHFYECRITFNAVCVGNGTWVAQCTRHSKMTLKKKCVGAIPAWGSGFLPLILIRWFRFSDGLSGIFSGYSGFAPFPPLR